MNMVLDTTLSIGCDGEIEAIKASTDAVHTPHSSNVSWFAWRNSKLWVGFKNDSVYRYDDVPLSVFARLKKEHDAGGSIGKLLRPAVKPYQYTRMK